MQISNPKSAAEILKEEQERREKFLLKRGTYDFECIKAEDKLSKTSGKPMIEVELKVYGEDGSEHFVRDYLMEALAHKLYHFAHGCGLGDQYDAGEIDAEDLIGKCGKVKIKIEKNDTYGDKNTVQDYVMPKVGEEAPAPKSHPADDEDMPDFLRK